MSTASAPISIASAISRDQVARMRADDAAADDAVRVLVEQQLGEAFVAAVGDRAPGRGPREQRLLDGDALRLGLVLGDAGPRDLGVGVGHRRNDARVEVRFLAGGHLGGDVAFVHRLVREHRLADDVADREDVRHVGAHLAVDAR